VFFFEASWLEENCEEVVKEGWEQGESEGLVKIDQLIGRVAGNLSWWSSNVLWGLEKKRKKTKKDLDAADVNLFQRMVFQKRRCLGSSLVRWRSK
jgi:hypothetical protein